MNFNKYISQNFSFCSPEDAKDLECVKDFKSFKILILKSIPRRLVSFDDVNILENYKDLED